MTLLEQAPSPSRATGSPGAAIVALVAHARSVPSLRREAFASELAALGEDRGHVVVHTCHRVELYVAPQAFRGELPVLPAGGNLIEDAAAARHLISVGCGLDSAAALHRQGHHLVLGEAHAVVLGVRARRSAPSIPFSTGCSRPHSTLVVPRMHGSVARRARSRMSHSTGSRRRPGRSKAGASSSWVSGGWDGLRPLPPSDADARSW